MAHPKLNIVIGFDKRPPLVRLPPREVTRRTRPGTKWGTKKYRSIKTMPQKGGSSSDVKKPHLQRSSSLPARLENAPPTRKLFWFRPDLSPYIEKTHRSENGQFSRSFQECEGFLNGDAYNILAFERMEALPDTIEECNDEEELLGLAFLANDE